MARNMSVPSGRTGAASRRSGTASADVQTTRRVWRRTIAVYPHPRRHGGLGANAVALAFLYYLANHTSDLYKITKVPKANGKLRTIEAPDEGLKFVQRMILDRILPARVSKIALAFEPKIGLRQNAEPHIGQKVVLALDLKDFFPSLRFGLVCRLFETRGYPRQSAVLLSKLCTLRGHLPQGAPTSPHLANLLLIDFDKALAKLCRRMRLKVTRYADDITISGNLDPMKIELLIATIRESLKAYGLRINYRKVRILRQNACQEVTGIVVNEKMSVPRAKRRELRQTVHYLKRFGMVGREPASRENLQSLLGSLTFVTYVDPNNAEFAQYVEYVRARLKECA